LLRTAPADAKALAFATRHPTTGVLFGHNREVVPRSEAGLYWKIEAEADAGVQTVVALYLPFLLDPMCGKENIRMLRSFTAGDRQ
jgi:hypothetical protein